MEVLPRSSDLDDTEILERGPSRHHSMHFDSDRVNWLADGCTD